MERYGFFSSVNEDRLYTAQDFTRYFSRFLQNGYFSVEPDGLKVTTDTLLNLSVKPGVMWINGHVYELLEPKILAVDTEANLSRRDRVVVVLDHVNREIRTEIKKGIASDNPEYPALERSDDRYEMCIAQYQVDKGITQLIPSMIIDTRKDIELCGELTSILDKRSLLDFCQISGFNMEGTINSKDLMPRGEANIGASDKRYKKIYCDDIDITNGIPYLSDKGGKVEGTVEVQDIIPLLDKMFRLGTMEKKFYEVVSEYIVSDKFSGNPTFSGDGEFKVEHNTAKMKDLKVDGLDINGHKLFIQSEAPANAKTGDVWLKV